MPAAIRCRRRYVADTKSRMYNTKAVAESLWMGVPVVRLRGTRFSSRYGSSLLAAAGCTDLVAETPEQYIDIAARLADDLPRLKTLRRTLREMSIVNGLADSQQFARNLERAYTEMLGQVERQGYQLACHACGWGVAECRRPTHDVSRSQPRKHRHRSPTPPSIRAYSAGRLGHLVLCGVLSWKACRHHSTVRRMPSSNAISDFQPSRSRAKRLSRAKGVLMVGPARS